MKYFFKLSLLFFLFSCAHSVHMVHTNDFDNTRGLAKKVKPIEVRTKQFVVLGFAFDTNYVDEAKKKLEGQCLDGRLEGVTTQFSTSLGFFSWTNKILIKAFCLV